MVGEMSEKYQACATYETNSDEETKEIAKELALRDVAIDVFTHLLNNTENKHVISIRTREDTYTKDCFSRLVLVTDYFITCEISDIRLVK